MDFSMDHIALNYAQTDAGAEPTGPVVVGWLVADPKGAVIYDPPKRVVSGAENRLHAKSASRCPAVLNLETRYFAVNCPFDLHLGFTRTKEGKPTLVNRAGTKSPIRAGKIANSVVMVSESEWRYPDRPTVQLKLPYLFIADEPVYMTQLDAFLHYRKNPLPGTIFGGRFPIHVWPRPLMWAIEWADTSKDLILKRGEPLFYLQFEVMDPSRPVQMVEAEMTEDLQKYLDHVSGAVNYVNQTFSLFKAAERVRPQKIVKRVERS